MRLVVVGKHKALLRLRLWLRVRRARGREGRRVHVSRAHRRRSSHGSAPDRVHVAGGFQVEQRVRGRRRQLRLVLRAAHPVMQLFDEVARRESVRNVAQRDQNAVLLAAQ